VFKKLTLAAAAGAGYVLGAKAGKERYAQIESKFREIAGMPAVQSATATVVDTASSVADSAKSTVNDKVEAVADKASSKSSKGNTDVVVDLGTGANTGATAAAPKATMAGAAPSGSAPDITRP
jgi:hypothetical protein